MNTTAIVLENVSRLYPGGVRAVHDVSLRVQAGEWVALMGPSGSGKTTLLNLIDGLDRPTSGSLCILGRDTTPFAADEAATFRRENLGLIFQQFHLIPYLTALENVMVAQYYHSLVDKKQAMRAMAAVQLTERAHHLPSQLSGGEQQRVCLARALINEPKIILADEPTANLDEANEAKVFEIFQTLHEQGQTIVVATHDPALGGLSQRKVLLRHGRIAVNQPEQPQSRVGLADEQAPTGRILAQAPVTTNRSWLSLLRLRSTKRCHVPAVVIFAKR